MEKDASYKVQPCTGDREFWFLHWEMGNLAISLTFFTYLGEKYKQHKGGVFCCLLKHSEQPRGCDAVCQRARKGRLAAEMHPDSLALSNTLHSVSVKYPPNAEQFHLFFLGIWAEDEAVVEKGRTCSCSYSSFSINEEAVPCLLPPSFPLLLLGCSWECNLRSQTFCHLF